MGDGESRRHPIVASDDGEYLAIRPQVLLVTLGIYQAVRPQSLLAAMDPCHSITPAALLATMGPYLTIRPPTPLATWGPYQTARPTIRTKALLATSGTDERMGGKGGWGVVPPPTALLAILGTIGNYTIHSVTRNAGDAHAGLYDPQCYFRRWGHTIPSRPQRY